MNNDSIYNTQDKTTFNDAVILEQCRQRVLEMIARDKEPPPPPGPEETLTGINGRDPMSPYRVVKSTVAYDDIADLINRKGFPAIYPQSYTPIPDYFLRNNIPPYFNPGEDVDYAKGSLTIAGMIELTNNGQPWALQRDEDIEDVLTLTLKYKDYIRDYVDKNDNVRRYIPQLEKFIAVMKKGRQRMYRRKGIMDAPAMKDIVSMLQKLLRGA